MYTCTCVYIHLCTYVHMNIRIYVHIHICTHGSTWSFGENVKRISRTDQPFSYIHAISSTQCILKISKNIKTMMILYTRYQNNRYICNSQWFSIPLYFLPTTMTIHHRFKSLAKSQMAVENNESILVFYLWKSWNLLIYGIYEKTKCSI